MKNKIKFNVIDALIIAGVILVLAVFGYYALGGWEMSDSGKEKIMNYTVEIQGVPEEYLNKVNIGDDVFDVRKGSAIGKVAAVGEARPYKTVAENINEGAFVMSEVPGKYTFDVTIRTPYKESAAGYTVNDMDLKVGRSVTIKTAGLATDAVILKLEKEGE